jgi:hypothetical protein
MRMWTLLRGPACSISYFGDINRYLVDNQLLLVGFGVVAPAVPFLPAMPSPPDGQPDRARLRQSVLPCQCLEKYTTYNRCGERRSNRWLRSWRALNVTDRCRVSCHLIFRSLKIGNRSDAHDNCCHNNQNQASGAESMIALTTDGMLQN